jgi:hypothetical protein
MGSRGRKHVRHIRSYSGDGLADVLVEREDEIRGVISSIDGFQSYYALRTGGGTTTISIFDDRTGAEASTAAAGGLDLREPARCLVRRSAGDDRRSRRQFLAEPRSVR